MSSELSANRSCALLGIGLLRTLSPLLTSTGIERLDHGSCRWVAWLWIDIGCPGRNHLSVSAELVSPAFGGSEVTTLTKLQTPDFLNGILPVGHVRRLTATAVKALLAIWAWVRAVVRRLNLCPLDSRRRPKGSDLLDPRFHYQAALRVLHPAICQEPQMLRVMPREPRSMLWVV